MALPEIEPRVHDLLLQSLCELDVVTDAEWSSCIELLCGSLLSLDSQLEETLSAVVRASMVIQQFLLALAAPGLAGPTRAAVLDSVRWLLDNVHNDELVVTPAGRPPGAVTRSSVNALSRGR